LDSNHWDLDHITKYTRYRRAMQRDFNRALTELKTLQADRALRAETESPSLSGRQMASAAPPLALVEKLAKQTQFLYKRFENTELDAAVQELEAVLSAAR
jgi:23S rRNA A2030 N6-methylase RlmJ